MRIAFAGNPNSGKTTMYNALTGRNERVGNWAGESMLTTATVIQENAEDIYAEAKQINDYRNAAETEDKIVAEE